MNPMPNKSSAIAEIWELYQDVREIERMELEYKQQKKELKDLQKEIDVIKEERKAIQALSAKKRIQKLEQAYSEVFARIDAFSLENSTCSTLADIKRVLVSGKVEIIIGKSRQFIESNLEYKCLLPNDSERLFGFSKAIMMTIKADIEELFGICKNSECHREILGIFQSEICKAISGRTLKDICILRYNGGFALAWKAEGLEDDYALFSHEFEEITLETLGTCFDVCAQAIVNLLKTNMEKALINASLKPDKLKDVNELALGTALYINEIEDWAVRIAIKEAIAISREPVLQIKGTEELLDSGTGIFITKAYSRLRNCQSILDTCHSRSGDKARHVMSKAINRFFVFSDSADTKTLFANYSDIVAQLKLVCDEQTKAALQGTREEIFLCLMQKSIDFKLNFDRTALENKSILKGVLCNFTENLDLFVTVSEQSFFVSQFFYGLYEKVIAAVLLDPGAVTRDEANSIVDVLEYAVDLSFEYRRGHIENKSRIKCLSIVMGSSLSQVTGLFQTGSLCLEKSELRRVIRKVFPQSGEREDFLEMIY